MKLSALAEQSVVILGLGREGQATYRYLRKHLPGKPLTLADASEAAQIDPEFLSIARSDSLSTLHLGPTYLNSLASTGVIIRSPGIPSRLPEIADAVKAGSSLASLTALFFSNCRGQVIGITGTKGKSTTSALTAHILQSAQIPICLVGNIGIAALDLLERDSEHLRYVYELSSYQLEGLSVSPHIAVILNLYREHLDHHGTFDEYLSSKENISRHQTSNDYLLFNSLDPAVSQIASRSPARQVPFTISENSKDFSALRVAAANTLPGRFNMNNVLAAAAVSKLLGVQLPTVVNALASFKPLENRLELVGEYRKIRFYNAPLATVPEATIAHLEALGNDVETVLLGGFERHLDYSTLGERLLECKVRNLILFPTTGPKIWEAVKIAAKGARQLPQAIEISSMREAVQAAYEVTAPGKICLHSPASASYNMFRNHIDRGDQFRRCVLELGPNDNTP